MSPMPRSPIIVPGQRFGRLIVELRCLDAKGRAFWSCVCDCGARRERVGESSLRKGSTRSCGCLHVETSRMLGSRVNMRHGMSRTPTHRSWQSMIARCTNPNINNYRYYGARGIVVCDRWLVFENFLADMGHRPAGCSLDRINTNGNYEPGNCRWATAREQALNRRKRPFCMKGHADTPDNVYEWRDTRRCQKCRRAAEARSRARRIDDNERELENAQGEVIRAVHR